MSKLLIFLMLAMGCGGFEKEIPDVIIDDKVGDVAPEPSPEPSVDAGLELYCEVPKKCKRIIIVELIDGGIDVYCDNYRFNRWKYYRNRKRMICSEE